MYNYLKAYLKYDPAAKSIFEVALLYPGPKSLFFHRIAHSFYRSRLFFVARLVGEISRWLTGIEIHPGAKIGKRFVIDHGMGTVIGETTEIGDDCLVFQGVTLGGVDFRPVKRHPTLQDRVVVGAGAQILGPIILGEACRIGANSVVTRSVPPHTTYAGIPARAIDS